MTMRSLAKSLTRWLSLPKPVKVLRRTKAMRAPADVDEFDGKKDAKGFPDAKGSASSKEGVPDGGAEVAS